MSEQRARLEIERAFPDLDLREVAFLGAGVDSAAYLVNGTWVFRFPKREAVGRALEREIALLPRLAPRLPVAVPRFAYVGQQTESGLPFAGYQLIPGQPLTAELFEGLPRDDQERILDTLAAFLVAVHEFPVDEAAALGVEPFSTRAWVEGCWSAGRAAVLPLLAPSDREALASLIARFLADERNVAVSPALLYADFAPEHVLYDREARAIAGIIDWGDLAIGDSDFDLLYLYQDYGEGFVRRLLARYPHPDPERLVAKLRVFTACDYVQTVADAQRNDGSNGSGDGPDDDAVRECVDALTHLLHRV